MKKIFIELTILLAMSSFIIFFQFNEVPKKLSWDEVEFTRLALSLDHKAYTPYSELATGHSTLYFYVILASFKLFGVTNFALRLPAALFGVLNVGIFYLIAQIAFSKIKYFKIHSPKQKIPILNGTFISLIPFFASVVLITSRWYFNFARFSFEATFLLFLELISIYFFLKFALLSFWGGAMRRLQNRSSEQRFRTSRNDNLILILSAIFAGLAFFSYYPGRIFFVLPFFFLILYSQKQFAIKNILIFSFTFLLTVSPLLSYLITHKDQRIQEQLFFTDRRLDTSRKMSYIKINILKAMFMFNLEGDLNGRHNYPGKPIFNPVIGAFFIFGLIITVIKYSNFYNLFFLSFFILSLVPTFLTYPAENPNTLRAYTAVVPAVYFVGNGIIYLLQSEHKSKMLLIVVFLALTFLFTLSSLYDLRTYFLYQKQVFKSSFELNGTIQRILNLKLWEKSQMF